MSQITKIAATFLIAASVAVPPVAWAQSSGDGSTEASQKKAADSSDSEFERTRQHMIEVNKESQRTGKM